MTDRTYMDATEAERDAEPPLLLPKEVISVLQKMGRFMNENTGLAKERDALRELVEFSVHRFEHILEVWDDLAGARETQHMRREDAWGLEETIAVIRDWLPKMKDALNPRKEGDASSKPIPSVPSGAAPGPSNPVPVAGA